MSGPQHTPGPWHAGLYSSIVGVPVMAQPDPAQNTVVVAAAMGAAATDRDAVRREVEANARLIAAAPDLLAALKAVMLPLRAALDDSCRVDPAQMSVTLVMAERALLLASGAPRPQMDNPLDGRGRRA